MSCMESVTGESEVSCMESVTGESEVSCMESVTGESEVSYMESVTGKSEVSCTQQKHLIDPSLSEYIPKKCILLCNINSLYYRCISI